MRVLVCFGIFGVLGLLLPVGACSGPIQCDEALGLSSGRTDPNGASCTRACDCNNQRFSGACLKGVCVSFSRESCSAQGDRRACIIPKALAQNGCIDGVQTCQPAGFRERVWGDCAPSCQVCRPGQVGICYTGATETLGVGVCKTGNRKCDDKGQWGACTGETLPSEEVCNGKDDDCNGKVDNNCKGPEGQPEKDGAAGEKTNESIAEVEEAGTPEEFGGAEGEEDAGMPEESGANEERVGLDGAPDTASEMPMDVSEFPLDGGVEVMPDGPQREMLPDAGSERVPDGGGERVPDVREKTPEAG